MDKKILTEYDMKRVIKRAEIEFGKIKKGTEKLYEPQLNNLEHALYAVYKNNKISDRELQQCIAMIIYDLKSKIDNIDYDYSNIREERLIKFCHDLEMSFNPFINKEIKLTSDAYNNLKEVFKRPIMALLRIYDSIDIWRELYGIDGYFRMLTEYVLPFYMVGEYPYILEYQYIEE